MDFKNTVLIMTSNLGTSDLRKTQIGFAQSSEAVTHERTGLLVPPADAEALAAALRRLRDEPKLRGALGAGARQVAVAEFDARVQSQRLQQRLLDIIEKA